MFKGQYMRWRIKGRLRETSDRWVAGDDFITYPAYLLRLAFQVLIMCTIEPERAQTGCLIESISLYFFQRRPFVIQITRSKFI